MTEIGLLVIWLFGIWLVTRNEITVGVAGDAPAGPQPDKFGGKRG